MNKFSLLSLLSIALSTTSLSLSAIKLGDEVKDGGGYAKVKSDVIATTEQYSGLPKVPLVHPYNILKMSDTQPLLVLSGRFPTKVLSVPGDVTEGIKSAMATTGVTPEDPFFVVVQPYMHTYKASGDVTELGETIQLLRPMYAYTPSVATKSTEAYSESISLKAQIVGLEKPIEIKPDLARPHHFGVSVHNSGPGTDIISSGANMAVEALKGETTGFYGFYKALGRTINGTAVEDTRGVSVLHIMLSPKDSESVSGNLGTLFEFAGYTGAPVTVKGIVDNFKGLPFAVMRYTSDIIRGMCEDGE